MRRFAYLNGVWLIGGLLAAQTPYVQDASIGKAKEAAKEEFIRQPQPPPNGWPLFQTIPTSQWVGKRVIFKPFQGSEESFRQFGYQTFHREGSPLVPNASYEELSGKIGRIVAVGSGAYPEVTVAMEGSEARWKGTVYTDLSGIAFLDEIDQARKELIGKTGWVVSPLVDHLVTYDAGTHRFGLMPVKRLSPVTIVNVVVGSEGHPKGWTRAAIDIVAPVRLIVRTEGGEEAFMGVYLSGTNAPKNWQDRAFSSLFASSDPRKDHDWPTAVWQAIENGDATLGMSPEQVRMALGEPTSRRQAQTAAGITEDWDYRGVWSVHFVLGAVTELKQGGHSSTGTGGEVTLGTTPEQVKTILGNPSYRREEQTDAGLKGVWLFDGTSARGPVYVDFARGLVTSVNISSKSNSTPPLRTGGAAEVDEISRVLQSGRYQSLPPLQQTPGASSTSAPRLTVRNQTAYMLRILLSGPIGPKTISLPAEGSQSIDLLAGTYKALASVDAPNVLPAVGDYSFGNGSEYGITYTISNR